MLQLRTQHDREVALHFLANGFANRFGPQNCRTTPVDTVSREIEQGLFGSTNAYVCDFPCPTLEYEYHVASKQPK